MTSPVFDAQLDHFEYERRFYCKSVPSYVFTEGIATLIIQSYYVYDDNFALRIRLIAKNVTAEMTVDTDPIALLGAYRDKFTEAYVTVKGPAVGGTRYEAEMQIDADTAGELIFRGGKAIAKMRYNIWQGEDGWNIDVFGYDNYPLIVAEVERHNPVTNLTIPPFCTTEITDVARFSNDGLAKRPFSTWREEFENELAEQGSVFLDTFGRNRKEDEQDM